MAKKKSKTLSKADGAAATRKKRRRRTPDQIIADLQEEIQRVRERSKSRKLKESPAYKAALSAIRSLDKGLDAAAEENHPHLRHALADARKALGGFLESEGVNLPKANLPKGPRPK